MFGGSCCSVCMYAKSVYMIMVPVLAVKALKRPACPEEAISEKRNALDESQSGERHLRAPVDLVVLNIDFGTTKDSLVKYFEKFGKVEFAEVRECLISFA
uniref:RRM domain-containing protein n=1 Tax=Parascaris equorum TaxID=6256 RepID=A0A914S5C3_PAREQ